MRFRFFGSITSSSTSTIAPTQLRARSSTTTLPVPEHPTTPTRRERSSSSVPWPKVWAIRASCSSTPAPAHAASPRFQIRTSSPTLDTVPASTKLPSGVTVRARMPKSGVMIAEPFIRSSSNHAETDSNSSRSVRSSSFEKRGLPLGCE